MVDPTRPVWIVRSGKNGQRDSWCIEEGVVGGGWRNVPDLTPCQDREDVRNIVKEVYGTDKAGVVANYTGQLWALRSRIQPGDTVVLPLKTTSQIAIGRCTRGYEYKADESEDKRIQIAVDWEVTDLPRTAVKQDLLFTLGSAQTVFQASKNDASARIAALAATRTDPGYGASRPESKDDYADQVAESPEVLPDIAEFARDRIERHITENFMGHDMARLVAAVLETKGFVCEVAGPGKDGGIDIIAGQGPLGLDSPRIIVQVKSGANPVSDEVVRDLQGLVHGQKADQGLLVAWGGLTRQALGNIAHNRFAIRVWDAKAVVDEILDVYPQLPEDIRAEIPLQMVWILTQPDSQT